MQNQNGAETSFVNGLELSAAYFEQEIRPALESSFPGLPYAAALIGNGSEVLGFDTLMSSDHCWGPRVLLFLEKSDYAVHAESVLNQLGSNLPVDFRGYPTVFIGPAIENASGNKDKVSGIENYGITVQTANSFFEHHLGFDINREIEVRDWLTFPEQKLATLTAGAIFHDAIGLESTRARFAYYPRNVWLYLLACGWARIEEEEHLMGRAGFVGDEIGSALIGARLVRDIMRLCFLMEKKYAPYPKWFGSAFLRLQNASALAPLLTNVLHADSWQTRQKWLCQAYKILAEMHNSLGLTEPLNTDAMQFHDRPFLVISMGTFSKAISSLICDAEFDQLLQKPLIGSIDQFSDSTAVLSDSSWRASFTALYA